MSASADAPARLALQTGRLDDRRASITPEHRLWSAAYELFVDQAVADGLEQVGEHDRRMFALCDDWPVAPGQAEALHAVEALAVAVALAAPFAAEDRILAALATEGSDTVELRRRLAERPVLAAPQDAPRPRLPHIYDPDASQPCPIVPLLDGPRSPMVAELLHRIKERDRNLADAMVLGADVDMLDSLERLGAAARGAGRSNLAELFEHDRQLWSGRAEGARARQRLESTRYHWLSDNVPPEGMEAARAEIQHEVEVLLHLPPRSDRSRRPA
jgi:hypothetical protein